MNKKKTTTIRLDTGQAELLKVAADIDEVSPTDIFRDAIKEYIGNRAGTDEEFAKELRAVLRHEWDEGLEQIRSSLGETALGGAHTEYPEWMREPEQEIPSSTS